MCRPIEPGPSEAMYRISAPSPSQAASLAAPDAKPPRRRGAKGSGPDGEVLEPHEVRKEELGVDSSGSTYWLLDCWDTSQVCAPALIEGARSNVCSTHCLTMGPLQEDGVNYGVLLYREQPGVPLK